MKKFIDGMIHSLKEKALSKCNEVVDRQVQYVELKQVKSCLAFSTADEEGKKAVAYLAKRLGNVKVDKLYVVEEETDMIETDDLVLLRKEDLSFGGKIRNEYLEAMCRRKYDLAVDLTMLTTPVAKYVFSHTKASLIAGMKKEGNGVDLVVEPVEHVTDFVNKLVRILGDIKKG